MHLCRLLTLISIPILMITGADAWAQTAGQKCEGWIAVESKPESGASVWVDGKDRGQRTPATLKGVPCGPHTVKVSLPYYVGAQKKIQVKHGEVSKLRLVLKANFGSLNVTTKPAGAKIFLDGKEIGKAPMRVAKVKVGDHKLKAVFPDYLSEVKKFKIKQGKKVALGLDLRPAFGKLVIKTAKVKKVEIFVNGDALGSTPLTLNRFPTGSHTIRVIKDLHIPFEEKVILRSGKTLQVVAKLKPNFGTLAIKSTPAGALVRVDGKDRGKTPLTLRLAVGPHKLAFKVSGSSRETVRKTVDIQLGKKAKLKVKLPVRTGSLMVDTVPFAATIELDGKVRGKAPLSLKKVPIGQHVIIAKIKGKEPLSGRIEVVEGQTSVAEINLNEPAKSVFRSAKAAPVAKQPEPKPAKKTPVAAVNTPEKKTQAKAEAAPAKKTAEPKPQKKEEKTLVKVEKKPETKTPPTKIPTGPPMSNQRVWAWVTASAAGATALTGVILFAMGGSAQSDADAAWASAQKASDSVRRDEFKAESEDLDQKAANLLTGGWITTGLAAVAAGTSIYLFVTEPETNSAPRTAVQFTPLPGGGYVGLGWRF